MLATGNGTTNEPNEQDVLAWRKRVVDQAADNLDAEAVEECRRQRQRQEEFRRNDRVAVRK